MKSIIIFLTLSLAGLAYAGGETKEVCEPAKDKAGKAIVNKDGTPKEVCKKIKVHKKLEGTEIPVKK